MATFDLKIDGMRCDGCAERINRLLVDRHGVRDASVSYSEGRATITYNPHAVTETNLREVIERAGFTPETG